MDNSVKKQPRKALGRGLSSLISSPAVAINHVAAPQLHIQQNKEGKNLTKEKVANIKENPNGLTFVDIEKIVRNEKQPRQIFNEQELNELAQSIKSHGVLQPIIVRKTKGDQYEIVAGERRWRAAKLAKISQLPVIIKNLSNKESYELAIIENIQRNDLNPIEEAKAYKHLSVEYSLTQEEIAERVGKERSTVTNLIRILSLNEDVTNLIADKKLSLGHAKVLLAVKEPQIQKNLAKKVIDENLSVRKLEEIVSRVVVLGKDKRDSHKSLDKTSFPDITDRLRKALGTKVIIRHHKAGNGKIELSYFSEDELDRLVGILCEH